MKLSRNVRCVYQPKFLLQQYSGIGDQLKGIPEQFSGSKVGNFFQEAPVLTNPFKNDHFLQRCLKRLLPEDVRTRAMFYDIHVKRLFKFTGR